MPPAFRHLFSVLFQASWIIALSVLAPSASFAAPGGGEPGEHTIAVTDNVIAANIFGTMTQRDTWSNGELFHRSISFISPEGEKATTAIWQDGKYLQFDMPGVSMRYTKHSNTKHEVKNLITGEVEIFSAIPENPASYQYADLLTFDESLANYLYNFLTEYDSPTSTAEFAIFDPRRKYPILHDEATLCDNGNSCSMEDLAWGSAGLLIAGFFCKPPINAACTGSFTFAAANLVNEVKDCLCIPQEAPVDGDYAGPYGPIPGVGEDPRCSGQTCTDHPTWDSTRNSLATFVCTIWSVFDYGDTQNPDPNAPTAVSGSTNRFCELGHWIWR